MQSIRSSQVALRKGAKASKQLWVALRTNSLASGLSGVCTQRFRGHSSSSERLDRRSTSSVEIRAFVHRSAPFETALSFCKQPACFLSYAALRCAATTTTTLYAIRRDSSRSRWVSSSQRPWIQTARAAQGPSGLSARVSRDALFCIPSTERASERAPSVRRVRLDKLCLRLFGSSADRDAAEGPRALPTSCVEELFNQLTALSSPQKGAPQTEEREHICEAMVVTEWACFCEWSIAEVVKCSNV